MEKNEFGKEIFENMVSEQIGGYKFKNPLLLRQAFVRKSYTEENGGENNEVLEFIGDKVLDIAVVRYLTAKFGNDLHVYKKVPQVFKAKYKPKEFTCSLNEGELTKLKQKMVEKKALAKRIDELGLAQFLIMGKGDEKQNMSEAMSVKEDLFEALLGAVALDSNWDFEEIKNVAEIMLNPDSFLDNGEESDYVGLIYEWEEKKNATIPLFKYDKYHDPIVDICRGPRVEPYVESGNHSDWKYEAKLKISISEVPFAGYGVSKHEARKMACKNAYQWLEKNNLLFSIADELENPNVEDAINQLEILARRGYFDLPEYSYEEKHDSDGNPVWQVECCIEGEGKHFIVGGKSKKTAKKEAAFRMLKYMLEAKNL